MHNSFSTNTITVLTHDDALSNLICVMVEQVFLTNDSIPRVSWLSKDAIVIKGWLLNFTRSVDYRQNNIQVLTFEFQKGQNSDLSNIKERKPEELIKVSTNKVTQSQ
jgi:hypothetical protein